MLQHCGRTQASFLHGQEVKRCLRNEFAGGGVEDLRVGVGAVDFGHDCARRKIDGMRLGNKWETAAKRRWLG